MSSIVLLKIGVVVACVATQPACGNHPGEASPANTDTTRDQQGPTEGALELRQVATLRSARAVHTATTLQSGEVLLVGGMSEGGGGIASVELFNPANNTIQDIGSLGGPRLSHTATLLGDGRVLIAGGYNGDYMASLEMYDPSTKRFRPGGTLLEARSGQTATLLPDGRVLFIGGVGRGWTYLRSAELYDAATGRSELVGSMSVAREGHTATLLTDGRVLVVGGHNGRRPNVEVFASAEIFTPQTGRFETTGSLSIARHKHDAVRLVDGRVLVIAGADVTDRTHYLTTEIYDPGTATFAAGPSMANRRYKIAGTSILLPGGDVLVTSGAPVAEILEIGQLAFRTVPGRFPAAYRFSAVAPLSGGDVVVTGGYSDGNQNARGVWRFVRP